MSANGQGRGHREDFGFLSELEKAHYTVFEIHVLVPGQVIPLVECRSG